MYRREARRCSRYKCTSNVSRIQSFSLLRLTAQVDIYRLLSGAESGLERLTDWNHNYLVVSVVVADNKIIVGDAVSSLAILRLEKDRLETVSRDYSPLWPLCIGMFDSQTIVGANVSRSILSITLSRLILFAER